LKRVMICLIFSHMVTWRILVAGLCLALLCLLAPRPSAGEPFLICDPYPNTGDQPTRFLIVVGKLKYSVPPQWLPDRSVRLKFDLSQLPDGEHTVNVMAIDDRNRGESGSIRLKLVKTGTKVTLLTSPEKAEPPAPAEKQQKGKIPPSRIPRGLLRPTEPRFRHIRGHPGECGQAQEALRDGPLLITTGLHPTKAVGTRPDDGPRRHLFGPDGQRTFLPPRPRRFIRDTLKFCPSA
jgi:hypothetical protein